MKKVFINTLLLLMVYSVNVQAHMQHSTDEAMSLLKALKKGGHILYIRHERTNMSILDQKDLDVQDCSTQRNLSYSGVASSYEIGNHIKSLGILVDKVLSSPLCRTQETARFMFNKYKSDNRLYGSKKPEKVKQDLLDVMVELKNEKQNSAIVAHLGNFYRMFGIRLQEGDAAIIKFNGDEPEYLGTIRSNQWNDFIIDTAFMDRHHS